MLHIHKPRLKIVAVQAISIGFLIGIFLAIFSQELAHNSNNHHSDRDFHKEAKSAV
jgi:hypothetical protein